MSTAYLYSFKSKIWSVITSMIQILLHFFLIFLSGILQNFSYIEFSTIIRKYSNFFIIQFWTSLYQIVITFIHLQCIYLENAYSSLMSIFDSNSMPLARCNIF